MGAIPIVPACRPEAGSTYGWVLQPRWEAPEAMYRQPV